MCKSVGILRVRGGKLFTTGAIKVRCVASKVCRSMHALFEAGRVKDLTLVEALAHAMQSHKVGFAFFYRDVLFA